MKTSFCQRKYSNELLEKLAWHIVYESTCIICTNNSVTIHVTNASLLATKISRLESASREGLERKNN